MPVHVLRCTLTLQRGRDDGNESGKVLYVGQRPDG